MPLYFKLNKRALMNVFAGKLIRSKSRHGSFVASGTFLNRLLYVVHEPLRCEHTAGFHVVNRPQAHAAGGGFDNRRKGVLVGLGDENLISEAVDYILEDCPVAADGVIFNLAAEHKRSFGRVFVGLKALRSGLDRVVRHREIPDPVQTEMGQVVVLVQAGNEVVAPHAPVHRVGADGVFLFSL